MTVSKILQSKGSADVVTVRPDVKVGDAARILSENRIGSLVVSTEGSTAEGILSERDIVRELGRRGPACLEDDVADMMTSKLVTADKSQKSDEVLATMTQGRFRHMPVLEDGKLIGIVTLGDVVKYRLNEVTAENEALESMIMGF